MSKVRRKVMMDLFAAPSTLLPMVGGATALIASWALGGDPLLTFGGVSSLLGGFGLFASRLVFGIEEMTEDAFVYVQNEERAQREAALADLDRRLTVDNDPRPETCLRQLRNLETQFEESVRQHGQAAAGATDIIEKVQSMFGVCVEQLEQTLQLTNAAEGVQGAARQRFLQQREGIIKEVMLTVEHVAAAIQRYQGLKLREKSNDLARLRQELDQSLQAARAAEERMAEWEVHQDRPESEH